MSVTLPDFGAAIAFIGLREAMGVSVIPTLARVVFERTVQHRQEWSETDRRDAELIKTLKSGVKEVGRDELSVDAQGLLTLEGRKVAAYIRDQRYSIDADRQTSNYRFHLCECSTIQSMRQAGRERRYLATQRRDGKFEVHDLSGYRLRRFVVKLNLCMNCRDELRARGIYVDSFNLEEFFKRFDSGIPRTIRRAEVVTEVQTYTPDHADRSREYRRIANYSCQLCRVRCEHEPRLLHLHHRDADPSNNTHENLAVLCVECHSRQPMHKHVTRTMQAQAHVDRIRQLRHEQGLPDFDLALAIPPIIRPNSDGPDTRHAPRPV